MKSLLRRITDNPKQVIRFLLHKVKLFRLIPDKEYLKIDYKLVFNKSLNLDNPLTYNEKIQWLKLYDRNPEYTELADKYAVRKFIEKKIGNQYLVPLFGVWESFEKIDFDKLPNEFVLKTTHDSGGVVICHDKNKLNYSKVKKKINNSLSNNYYYYLREWPYKNLKPKIIAEKLMVDDSGKDLKDYKFFCFNGEPKFMFIASNRQTATNFDFFDLNFKSIPVEQGYPKNINSPKKPKNFNKMIKLARILSSEIPHVRVDFYNVNGDIYFGEMTFYHFSGFVEFNPPQYDIIFGKYLNLPKKETGSIFK